MPTIKVNEEFTEKVIKNTYKTASLHASYKNDFGLFCMGAGVMLRSLFLFLSEDEHMSSMEIRILESTIHTNTLMKAFQDAKQDLVKAAFEKKDNKALSTQVLKIAKIARSGRK